MVLAHLSDDPPSFSLIIPTYNASEKLRCSLESVLAQPRNLFEVIVVDGASTDGTDAVLREYGGLVRSVSERDRGVYDAMNKGITLSRGRYLYFLGAGDTLRPGVLQAVAQRIPASGPAIVYGDVFRVKQNDRARGEFDLPRFRRMQNVYHQAIFYSREVFERLGGYDLRYPLRADNVLNMRAWADPIIRKQWIDLVIADYEGGGMSDTSKDEAFYDDFPKLVRDLLGWKHLALYRAAEVKYKFVARRKEH